MICWGLANVLSGVGLTCEPLRTVSQSDHTVNRGHYVVLGLVNSGVTSYGVLPTLFVELTIQFFLDSGPEA